MINCDNIIEEKSLFLRNAIINNINNEPLPPRSPNNLSYTILQREIGIPTHLIYYGLTINNSSNNNYAVPSNFRIDLYRQGSMGVSPARYGNNSNTIEANTTTKFTYVAKEIYVNKNAISTFEIYQTPNVSSLTINNVFLYDIEDLYNLLKMNNIVTSEFEMLNWCNNNLQFVPSQINYNITNLLPQINAVQIKAGNIHAKNFYETEGLAYINNSEDYLPIAVNNPPMRVYNLNLYADFINNNNLLLNKYYTTRTLYNPPSTIITSYIDENCLGLNLLCAGNINLNNDQLWFYQYLIPYDIDDQFIFSCDVVGEKKSNSILDMELNNIIASFRISMYNTDLDPNDEAYEEDVYLDIKDIIINNDNISTYYSKQIKNQTGSPGFITFSLELNNAINDILDSVNFKFLNLSLCPIKRSNWAENELQKIQIYSQSLQGGV